MTEDLDPAPSHRGGPGLLLWVVGGVVGSLVLLAALGVILVRSLGGDEAPATAKPTPTPTTSTTSTTTAGSSVEQWAGEVAALQSRWQDAEDEWEDATCSASAVEDAPDCRARLLAMSFDAAAAEVVLDGIQNPASGTYLGSPPEEIATLVAETTDAAAAASEAGQAVDCPGPECLSTAMDAVRAWGSLGDAYAKWSPYL